MNNTMRPNLRQAPRGSAICVLTVAGLLTAVLPSQAANISWIDGTASYNIAANWNSNAVPGTADVGINNQGTNNAVQINAGDPAWTIIDLQAGNDTNGPVGGAFELNGSSVSMPNGWFRLAMTSNSAGLFTLNDGTLNFGGGRMQSGEGANSMTVISINGGVINKTGGGIGLNFSDGGWGGQHSATTLVTQTAGRIDTRGETWIGQFTGGVTTYNLHGGTINSSNWFVVSRAGAQGTLNMDGGSITHVSGGQPAFIVGDRAGTGGGVGIFNFSAGTVTTIGAEYWIGNGEAASGTNNMSGTAALTVNNWLAVGRENSVGELNLADNASVTKSGGGNVVIGTGGGVGGLGIINQNGGTLTVSSGQVWLGENGVANGFWHLNDGLVVLGILEIAHANSANGTFNLNGGTLTASEVRKGGSTGIATFNFNGGTLKASADNPTFMHDLTTVDLQAGGAVIDTDGHDVTISSAINDFQGQQGSLTKNGGGTLRLTGNNFYTGDTIINAGELILNTGSFASGDYSMADGAGLGVMVTSAGAQMYAVDLTLGTSGATTMDFDLGSFGNPPAAPINVSGTLAVNGTVTVNIAAGLPQVGQFPLIQYGSKTGTGNFVLGERPTGMEAEIVVNTINNTIDLNITQVDAVRWDGTANGNWDIASTTNWINTGTLDPAVYADGNPTTFNDLAIGPTSVNITTTVNPNGVTVDNSTLNYDFTGSGKISGPISLTKSGTGTLTIANTGNNDYTGPTRVLGGTLSVNKLANGGSPSSIGSSSSHPTNLALAGGTLAYTGPAVSIDRGYSVSGTNNAIQTDANLTVSGTVQVAPGSVFLKTGTGTLAYTKGGTNEIGRGGAPGFGAYNVVSGALLLDGTAGPQTNYNVGELWVGGTTTSGASLVLSNSILNGSGWVALGRGNGSDDYLSSVRLENSTMNITSGGFSAGYDANLPLDFGIMVLARQEVTLNGNSAINVANGPIFFAERRGSTATVKLNDTSALTNSANAGVGIGVGGSISGSTGMVEIAESALWRVGSYFSLGHEGGVATMVVKDNGSFFVGTDLNVTDVGPSTGTLIAQDNAHVEGNIIYVGKDNDATGIFTITNDATAVARSSVIMGRHWQGHGVTPITAEINLAGGSLAAGNVQGTTNSSAILQGTFNFNGGRLIARNQTTNVFMFDLAAISVMSGGAVIDSDTNTISIAQALLDAGGGGGLTKLGTGTLYLNGANTYSGPTLVSAGTLGGTGTIVGPVTVASTGALAPGTSIGLLTINNTLTLGGNAVMEISRDTGAPDSDRVTGLTTLTYGGTLTVTNNGTNALQVGDTFYLFNAATIVPSGFAALNLPAGYTWNTNQLAVNGSISVSAIVSEPPVLDPPVFSGGSLILTGSGAPGAPLTLLTSTNVAVPLASWQTNLTGVFDGTGSFSNSIPVNTAEPTRYFNLRTP